MGQLKLDNAVLAMAGDHIHEAELLNNLALDVMARNYERSRLSV